MFYSVFENKRFNEHKLKNYGFLLEEAVYSYSFPLMDGKFQLKIAVTLPDQISVDILDTLSQESYILPFTPAKGEFVDQIRDQVQEILTDMAENVCEYNTFDKGQPYKILEFIKETWNIEPEFLWPKTPEYAVFRKEKNKKWFGLLMKIPGNKIGLDSEKMVDVINLKADPNEICQLIDYISYFPAWHMNKKHWMAVLLDNSISDSLLFEHIQKSWEKA